MEQISGYYNTFLIKIWCDISGSKLRGHIEHAGSRERAYFSGSEDMNRFILNHLDAPGSEKNLKGKDAEADNQPL